MRRGGRILIVLGLVIGIMAAMLTFVMLAQMQTGGQPVPMRSVVVAMQTIPGRTEITAEAVGKQDWPEGLVPVGAFEKIEDVVGKMALQPIYPGQIVLAQMVVTKGQIGTRTNAPFLIPDGKVAVALSISELSGVAGAIQPGDSVDILLTLSPEPLGQAGRTTTAAATGTEGLPVTQLMLQNVLVLQAGSWSTSEGKAAAEVSILTLVLDRQDALALKSAREQGTIDLALRRAGDTKIATTEPVNLQYLNKRFNFNLVPVPPR